MLNMIRTYAHLISQRSEDERGATAVEYGLMVALIAVVIIAAVVALGNTLNTSFSNTEDCIAGNAVPGLCAARPAAPAGPST